MVTISEHQIPALDGRALAATLFEPSDGTVEASVVINSATAVKRGYYSRYANFLAKHGLRVVTFDYRGIGGSRPARLARFGARMRDWAELDSDGVLAWTLSRSPGTRIMLLGHSFGGQCIGLLAHRSRLDAALMVGVQSGYWRLWPVPGRFGMYLLVKVLLPGLSRLLGYFPGKRLGMGEDLPGGVAREWAGWCRHPDYILSTGTAAAYGALSLPILAYSFADDRYAPRQAVTQLLGRFTAARLEHRHIQPRQAGLPAVGHFGFFRSKFRQSLWQESVYWLLAQAGPAASGREAG